MYGGSECCDVGLGVVGIRANRWRGARKAYAKHCISTPAGCILSPGLRAIGAEVGVSKRPRGIDRAALGPLRDHPTTPRNLSRVLARCAPRAVSRALILVHGLPSHMRSAIMVPASHMHHVILALRMQGVTIP